MAQVCLALRKDGVRIYIFFTRSIVCWTLEGNELFSGIYGLVYALVNVCI